MTTTPGSGPGSSSVSGWFARPGLALAVLVAAFAVTAVGTGPVGESLVPRAPEWAAVLVRTAVALLPLVVGSLVAARLAGPDVRPALGLRLRGVDLLLGLAVALIARAAVEIVTPTVGTLRSPLDDGSGGDATFALGLAIASLVVLAPLAEELFFRGAVQRALQSLLVPILSARTRSGERGIAGGIAIGVTTVAFALLHAVPYGAGVPLAVLMPPLAVGIGAGILTLVTGRIGGALVAHLLFNLAGVLLLLR